MSKHKSKSKQHREVLDIAEALRVVCPRCGAWTKKDCIHTSGSKVGQPTSPHKERLEMAKAISNLSTDTKRKLKDVEEAETEVEVKPKSKKDNLNSEQRAVVETITDKIYALQKHAEFVGPVTKGPIVSIYHFKPLHKTRVLHLEGMVKDFSAALGSEGDIVVKRMPGDADVSIFVPNKERTIIPITDTLPNVMQYMTVKTKDGHKKIPLNFGVTASGAPFVDDLTIQPHMLVAGSTDSGKSTLMNCLLLSMCWALTPKELRICVSDPKKVEFKPHYQFLPHLERPVAGDQYETMQLLDYLMRQTKARFDIFEKIPVRNIHEYNAEHANNPMPFIVLLLDELASIMGDQIDRTEAKANSAKLGSIVGLSRATGIYVIAGTQRPSVNTIKGSIKANFPTRCTFRLPSSTDSKTVITTKGAEHLISRGDMFYMSSARSDLLRLHAPWTEKEDLKKLVQAIIQKEAVANQKQKLSEEEEERIAIQQEGNGKSIDVMDRKKVM